MKQASVLSNSKNKTIKGTYRLNFGTNEEQIAGNRNEVLQQNDENAMGRLCNRRGCLTKSSNRAEDLSKKKQIKFLGHSEDIRARRIDTNRTCKREVK